MRFGRHSNAGAEEQRKVVPAGSLKLRLTVADRSGKSIEWNDTVSEVFNEQKDEGRRLRGAIDEEKDASELMEVAKNSDAVRMALRGDWSKLAKVSSETVVALTRPYDSKVTAGTVVVILGCRVYVTVGRLTTREGPTQLRAEPDDFWVQR